MSGSCGICISDPVCCVQPSDSFFFCFAESVHGEGSKNKRFCMLCILYHKQLYCLHRCREESAEMDYPKMLAEDTQRNILVSDYNQLIIIMIFSKL